MELIIGQKVAYPNQGVCTVEDITKRKIGEMEVSVYALRIIGDNSLIFVPTANAEAVGIRPVITGNECKCLIDFLETDFSEISSDWKLRSREFSVKIQSGDPFEVADVLKKLTFLSYEKKLSFREQSFLEKARFLLISEVTNADFTSDVRIEEQIEKLIACACRKHTKKQPKVAGH